MKLSNDQTKIMCELFEIPPEGADLITFFFTEEEIRFLLAVSAGEIRIPVPADTPGIDTAKEYRRGLLSKTDATGNFFRLNSFYGFLDVFCISNYEKYQSLPWEKRILLDEWYFREYLKTLDNGQDPPTSDRVLPLEEIVEEILSDPRPVYLNYCDCRSLTGACGLPRHTCITYKNGINTFVDRGLSEQIDPERATHLSTAGSRSRSIRSGPPRSSGRQRRTVSCTPRPWAASATAAATAVISSEHSRRGKAWGSGRRPNGSSRRMKKNA